MNTHQVVVHGHIRPDGTLEVDEKVDMPPGPVSITVQATAAGSRKRTLRVLEEIWSQREALGLAGRTKQEIDAEIDAMRNEDEARMREIEKLGGRPPTKTE
ncbi:MAG: hypothetical protein ABSG86_22325 [Thermoguttaceae bacterium]|jgi:hypothetical protein